MRHVIKITLLSLFLFFFLPTLVLAQTSSSRATRVITVPKDQVVDQDYFIKGGDIVEISGTVNGDVLIAGGQLLVDGTVNGDLLAAGGTINISGKVTQDARIAGGQITISGEVGRNLTIAGGNIELTKGGKVGGGLLAAGGNVMLSADVAGDVNAYCGNLTIADNVGGNVEAYVGSLRLTSNAQIKDDLVYTSDQDAMIDNGASVSGQLLKKAPPPGFQPERMPSARNVANSLFQFRIRATIISFLSALLIGILLVKLFPGFTQSISDIVSNKFWPSLGWGFLVFVIMPILVLVLFITIIGIPLAFVSLFTYIIFLYISKILVSYWLGMKLKNNFNLKSTFMVLLVGLVVYYIISIIPFIGGLFGFIVMLTGLGATFLFVREEHKKPAAKLASK